MSLLSIEYSKAHFPVGLCLAWKDFAELKKMRESVLHPSEFASYEKIKYQNRQHSYLLGRYCAKGALSCITQENPTNISIHNGVFHQPLVNLTNLKVSITHTGALGGAISFNDSFPMAIDIEIFDPEKEKTVSPLLTPKERILISSSQSRSPMTMFWTIKEALSKAIHCGLSVPLDVLEIATLKAHGQFYISTYKNFSQYQALSFFLTDSICTIVFPLNSFLQIDVSGIQETEGKLVKDN
jgi:4'-phosphopantetheinyl transferase